MTSYVVEIVSVSVQIQRTRTVFIPDVSILVKVKHFEKILLETIMSFFDLIANIFSTTLIIFGPFFALEVIKINAFVVPNQNAMQKSVPVLSFKQVFTDSS